MIVSVDVSASSTRPAVTDDGQSRSPAATVSPAKIFVTPIMVMVASSSVAEGLFCKTPVGLSVLVFEVTAARPFESTVCSKNWFELRSPAAGNVMLTRASVKAMTVSPYVAWLGNLSTVHPANEAGKDFTVCGT